MAINIPQEVKKRENPTAILVTAIFIVVIVLVVWSQFLRTPTEVKEMPTSVAFETFRRIPDIDLKSLYCPIDNTTKMVGSFCECPMNKTEGSTASEGDCQEEPGCFWDEDNQSCYQTNLLQLKIFEEIRPLYCSMEKTGGALNSEGDCQEEPGCFWDEDDQRCYKTPGRTNPFLPQQ